MGAARLDINSETVQINRNCSDTNFHGDLGELTDYIIPLINKKVLSEEEIWINKLSNIQSDILNKGFRIPENGIHSELGQKFYREILLAPSDVLEVLDLGYDPPIIKPLPKDFFTLNNKSARLKPEFVRQEVKKLLSKKVISKLNHKPFICSPLTVACRIDCLTNEAKYRRD